ncbi:threonine/serine dehydratase [Pseudomonas sp. S3E12]|uniref:threonine ammonia-lyase n=1 Tax=Pseudomonas sp. S3E12 TaxID=1873126 RepID=UPI00081BCDC2|nr:threonine/serine dehydratase [Pseudomonas sp. S3E12]OCW24109.1 hypothetical protein BB029_13490 [Pseudomonas sp. S3E12]
MTISNQDIFDAELRLEGVVRKTPVLCSSSLDRMIHGNAFIKADSLQWGGALKYRGVMNKLFACPVPPGTTIVAYSSGNHAVSVAIAARQHGLVAILVMPHDAPAIKIERAREQGAEIVFYDRTHTDRVALAQRLCNDAQGVLFPPFDDEDIICGQATATLELIRQCREQGSELDHILIPCGGGGLLSGAVLAVRAARSNARIWAVEPEGFDCMRRSMEAGCKIENRLGEGSICDALMARAPADITLELALEGRCGSLRPDDETVRKAVAHAFSELKLVVEPSGAIALAAVMSAPELFTGASVGVVLSGGNVDASAFAEIIALEAHLSSS